MAPPIIAAAMLSRNDGQHEHDRQQHEAALPVVGQESRQHGGHAAVLEVLGEQREAQQQAEEVRQDHPLVAEVSPMNPLKPRAGLKRREEQLVQRDHGEPGERDLQRVVMEERDAKQRQREEDELDRDPEQGGTRCGRRARGEHGRWARRTARARSMRRALPGTFPYASISSSMRRSTGPSVESLAASRIIRAKRDSPVHPHPVQSRRPRRSARCPSPCNPRSPCR